MTCGMSSAGDQRLEKAHYQGKPCTGEAGRALLAPAPANSAADWLRTVEQCSEPQRLQPETENFSPTHLLQVRTCIAFRSSATQRMKRASTAAKNASPRAPHAASAPRGSSQTSGMPVGGLLLPLLLAACGATDHRAAGSSSSVSGSRPSGSAGLRYMSLYGWETAHTAGMKGWVNLPKGPVTNASNPTATLQQQIDATLQAHRQLPVPVLWCDFH